MSWKRMLAYITGSVDQGLLLRNEYLATENRVLRAQIKGRLRLCDPERISQAEIGKRLGRRALEEVANIVSPDTILRWHRRLIAKEFDGSKNRRYPGRPRVSKEIERLVVQMARENRTWGYDRIVGALANLGRTVSDQTIGNVLRRHGLEPAPDRSKKTTWKEFIRSHMNVLSATDFFTAEVRTAFGLVTYYVLFFIRLATREVVIAGIPPNPDEAWMKQIARNMTMAGWGFLDGCRFLIHDRDTKYTAAFDAILQAAGIRPVRLPPHSPNLNAIAERFVLSAKTECLDRLILFGERSLEHVLTEFVELHYNRERPHQGIGNILVSPDPADRPGVRDGPIIKRARLGGLANFYHRRAA